MPTQAPTVAIVGGGALGAALVRVLALALAPWATLKPRIVLFEKSGAVGRGLAYAKDPAPYLLNQSAETMSLVPGRRSHFFDWLLRRGLATAEDGPHFCERQLFGDYAEDCHARALERAQRHGVLVTTVREEVTLLTPLAAGGHRLVSAAHPPVDAHAVVLAVGNLPSTAFRQLRGPSFVSSPYPSEALRARIPADARVAILGTGLSAIDAAIALFAQGHRGLVTMASRSGLLPTVRGPLHACELVHLTRTNIERATQHGPLRLETVLRWLELELAEHGELVSWDRDFPAWAEPTAHLEAEVAAAERGPRIWQSLGEAMNPMIEVVWHHLAKDERRTFEQHRSRFMSHWVPIPAVTAMRVLSLLRAGKLTVERGVGEVTHRGSQGYSVALPGRTVDVDFVINATGTPRHLHESDSPLLHTLVRQGTVVPHEHGGLEVHFESLRALGADGRVHPALFALGNLTCGTHLFTSTLEVNVEKVDRMAAHIADELCRRFPKGPHVDATPHSS